MRESLEKLKHEALKELKAVQSREGLFTLQKKYVGRKGILTQLLKGMKDMKEEQRKEIGKFANSVLEEVNKAIGEVHDLFILKEKEQNTDRSDFIDFSMPGIAPLRGHLHPVTHIIHKAQDIFLSMGFEVVDGPEVETQSFNFDLLNIPRDHPARDMQDTFHLESDVITQSGTLRLAEELVLRTHTSSVQLRSMLTRKPPVRLVVPGRCYRYEATDASHETTFHQLECLVIDEHISIRHLIATMRDFLSALFDQELKVRVRPSYFPFVEPGLEVDMNCFLCEQKGCSACKRSGWLEIAGAGMVHPAVLKNMRVDPATHSGFAFGMGIDRVMMLYFGVNDIRLVYCPDLRFSQQF